MEMQKSNYEVMSDDELWDLFKHFEQYAGQSRKAEKKAEMALNELERRHERKQGTA